MLQDVTGCYRIHKQNTMKEYRPMVREHYLCTLHTLHSNLAQGPGNADFVGNSRFWVNAAMVKQDRMFFREDRNPKK